MAKKEEFKLGKNIIVRPNGSRRVFTHFDHEKEPSLAQQQFKDECDVNHIMNQYKKTGEITHLNSKTGVYADFTEIGEYQHMLNTINEADRAFEELPSKLRARFENDPQKLIEYLQDPENVEESIKLGLRVKQEPPPKDPMLEQLEQINQNLSQPKA